MLLYRTACIENWGMYAPEVQVVVDPIKLFFSSFRLSRDWRDDIMRLRQARERGANDWLR